jgi:hypothetical protein
MEHKPYSKKFKADAYTSREYRCAVVLEEYLEEINQPDITRKVNEIMQHFNKFFKDLKVVRQKHYFGTMLLNDFEKSVMAKESIPAFARTLILNVIRTKYKVEILGVGKKE